MQLGIDEAGIGALAGPFVVAGVILPPRHNLQLNDSKQLGESSREAIYEDIKVSKAIVKKVTVPIGSINQAGINICWDRAVYKIIDAVKKDYPSIEIVVDGSRPVFGALSVIKGDQKIHEIMAASIVAKVTRDRYMRELKSFFMFRRHKGYGTKQHIWELGQYGITEHHRVNYKPVKKIMENIKHGSR